MKILKSFRHFARIDSSTAELKDIDTVKVTSKKLQVWKV